MFSDFPKNDGFYMPAEFSPHDATLIVWPVRPGSWGKDPRDSQKAFLDVIRTISESEKVFLLASESHYKEAKNAVFDIKNVDVIDIPTDDAWARDIGPTFLTDGNGDVRAVNWCFNAWGGEYDGLYSSWEKDDAAAKAFCKKIGVPFYDASPFVLEGGSIHSDGEGTIMVTETCLMSKGRNPSLSKKDIEENLKLYLGAEKTLWLPYGIYNDETNEHVDNVCAFISPGEVVLAWTDDKDDPQYSMSSACYDYLSNEVDAKGRKIKIHKLPIPSNPIICSENDVDAYEFELGEDNREIGERLAASYVNFYFSNGAVLVPQFGGDNEESDRIAVEILKKVCKNREIRPIFARAILMGGGNIHCITQQIPKGAING